MTTEDRGEYEAWWYLEKPRVVQGDQSLERIIADGLTPGDAIK